MRLILKFESSEITYTTLIKLTMDEIKIAIKF